MQVGYAGGRRRKVDGRRRGEGASREGGEGQRTEGVAHVGGREDLCEAHKGRFHRGSPTLAPARVVG